MGFLQRTAEGFLDLTGQRVGGKYPTGISDSAVPIIDIGQLLHGRLVASETAASLTSAAGDQATLTVPDNETWLLFNVGVEWVSTAIGQDLELKIYLTKLPGSSDPANKLMLADFAWYQVRTDTNGVMGDGKLFDPIALHAGTEIVAEVTDASENVLAWSIHAGLVKLIGN